jgi:hypothetical protein
LKPTQAGSARPYLRKTLHKNMAGGVTQDKALVQAPVSKKKKKKSQVIQRREGKGSLFQGKIKKIY